MRIIGTFTRCKRVAGGEIDRKHVEYAVISGMSDAEFNAKFHEMLAATDMTKYTGWKFKSIAVIDS